MGLRQAKIAVLVVMLSGCVTSSKFVTSEPTVGIGPAVTVVTSWTPNVAYVPDPSHGGAPAPGLAGRVYLFGERPDFPLCGDGSMVVDFFDDTPVNGQPSSTHLEQWRFDPVTLKRLAKKDTVGMGYTLFLPWGTYRHDIKTVHINLCYEPAGATPLYAPSGPMTIDHGTSPVATPPMQGPAIPTLTKR